MTPPSLHWRSYSKKDARDFRCCPRPTHGNMRARLATAISMETAMTGDRNITLSDITQISAELRFLHSYRRILRQLILDTAGNDEEGEAASILVTQLHDHVERLNTCRREGTARAARH